MAKIARDNQLRARGNICARDFAQFVVDIMQRDHSLARRSRRKCIG